ncbi:MAG: polysaccharide biosynthesis/export family protein [Pseudomonadota bacterium]
MRSLVLCAACLSLAAACASPPPLPSDLSPISKLSEPVDLSTYRIGPGDRLSVSVPSAPELSGTHIVGADGRIQVALIGAVEAAGEVAGAVEADLEDRFASELIDPRVDVSIAAFGEQQVFVGGAVSNPGALSVTGQTGPLEAIIMAGGFTSEAAPEAVLVIRRDPAGGITSSRINIKRALEKPRQSDLGALQRFDVVYVPRSAIANQNRFVRQYIRNALPLGYLLFYGAD